MTPYHDTKLKSLKYQLTIITIRGIYGIICGIIMFLMFSSNEFFCLVLYNVFGDYYQYFTWIYLVLFYLVTIVIMKILLKIEKRFDLYLRGASIYFALGILTYTILATT